MNSYVAICYFVYTGVFQLAKEVFSIIMPAKNAMHTISFSINSILNQTFCDFVIYIINDCSSDNTLSIINKFKERDNRVVVLTGTGSGVANARNLGIDKAEGKYIAFLDSDDIWDADKLMEQYNILSTGEYSVVCANYKIFKNSPEHIVRIKKFPEVFSYNEMLKFNHIGNLTGVYNAQRMGKIKQKNCGHEDYIMWLEIVSKVKQVYCIQKPLAFYRIGDQSLSSNKLKAATWQWKIYRHIIGLSYFKTCYYFMHYAMHSLMAIVSGFILKQLNKL